MSEIRANTVSNAAGTGPVTLTGQYAAKAWVNFNGTGTVAIRESGNLSSVVDVDVGTYDIYYTVAFADTNYCVVTATGGQDNGGWGYGHLGLHNLGTRTNFSNMRTEVNGAQVDEANNFVAVFR